MPEKSTIFTYAFIAILGILLITAVLLFGSKIGNDDNNNELSKQITIISVITAICVTFWTALTYFYFMANTDYVIPYIIISNGFILCVVLFSLGLKSLA
jgi:cell division protein FtsW (lipid II flippase)